MGWLVGTLFYPEAAVNNAYFLCFSRSLLNLLGACNLRSYAEVQRRLTLNLTINLVVHAYQRVGEALFITTLASPRLSRVGAPALTLVMYQLIKIVGGLNLFTIGLVGSSCHLKNPSQLS